ncbi:hypothetical protein AYO49_04305 [Verrucomicrobiaceae bacterium SCGC AG-212-N21]|nr:hypothetical protein AYO49_04305 [Verrucomicrobiaceae bacterium SCGC AG-212-N21]
MTWTTPVPRRSFFALCAAFSLSLVSPTPAAEKVEEWAKLLPESACIVISIRNSPELLKDWDESGLGRFLKDEAVKRWMAPLYKDGVPVWDQSFIDMSGSTFADNLAIYPGGTIAAILIDDFDDFEQDQAGVVALSEIAGKEAELDASKTKQLEAHRKGEHPDAVQTSKEIDGVTVKILAESDDADAEWLEGWAVVDGVAIEANDQEVMEEMIGRFKGAAGKDSPVADRLAKLTELRDTPADVSVLFDLDRFVKMAQDKFTEEAKNSPSPITPAQVFNALALHELHTAALCLDFTDAHSRADFVLLHDGQPVGIVPALMRGTSTEVPQLPFMPADVASGSVTRQSLGAIYDTVFKSINKLGPMAMMLTAQIQAMEQEAKINLRNDLLGSLDDVYMEVENFSPGPPGSPPVSSAVSGFKLKNRERFQAAFDAVMKMVGNGFGVFEESDFEGQKIFSLSQAQGSVSYTITDEYLFFAQGSPDLLHKMILRLKNPSGPGLWDQPRTQAALAALPTGFTGMAVSNGSTIIRTMLKTMSGAQSVVGPAAKGPSGPKGGKGPKAKGGKSKGAENGPTASRVWFDDSATPPDETFDKYFGMGATGVYSHPEATQILYISVPVEKQP